MPVLNDLLSRWTYTDREAEMIGDLFRRVPIEIVRRTVDYLLSTHKDFERPTFRQINIHIEQGVPSIDGSVASTMAAPPSGRELSKAEKTLFWQWARDVMTSSPEARAFATKRYMDASTAAGHQWSESFKQTVFQHWQRNIALAATVPVTPGNAHSKEKDDGEVR